MPPASYALAAADAGTGSICVVVAENDAERVASGVGENPEARLAFTGDTGHAQSEQFLFGLAGVAHADVQMHLLRVGPIGPARGNPVGSALEGQLPQPRPGTDDYPAVHVFVDPHPQYLAVELGKSARVRAVDHHLLKASEHTGIISASWSRPLLLIRSLA
jgi:hypothetical protein